MSYFPNNANGQTTKANSAPVVIASDQDALQSVGNVASAATDSGNPVKIGAKFNSTQPTFTDGQRGDLQINSRGELKVSITQATSSATVNTAADGAAATGGLVVNGRNQVLTGTTWDSQRAIVNANNSTGTGITAAGMVAQLDDTSPTAITENQFGNVRMNSVRALYGEAGPYLLGRATADTQIKGSAGFIHTISIAATTATPTAGLLTIYDNTAESGTVVYSEWVFATDVGHTVTLDVPCGTGIYAGYDATLANVQVTISYR